MKNITVRPATNKDKAWIKDLMKREWGANIIVSKGKVYEAEKLPGFIAELDGKPVGLITYHIKNRECEIISLNSLKPRQGVGEALIKAVKTEAIKKRLIKITAITTNDNLHASGWYQKRGFVLTAVYPNALAKSRKLKPQIPQVGINGIPLRDEIELELVLNNPFS